MSILDKRIGLLSEKITKLNKVYMNIKLYNIQHNNYLKTSENVKLEHHVDNQLKFLNKKLKNLNKIKKTQLKIENNNNFGKSLKPKRKTRKSLKPKRKTRKSPKRKTRKSPKRKTSKSPKRNTSKSPKRKTSKSPKRKYKNT